MEHLETHELVNGAHQVEARMQWQWFDACHEYCFLRTLGKNGKSVGFIFFIDNKKGGEDFKYMSSYLYNKKYVIMKI